MDLLELCAGVGGLSIACERVLGCRVAVQVDMDAHTALVRSRHWPDAEQVVADLRALAVPPSWHGMALTAGFPCQDLAYGGSGRGLDGARSGLFFEVLRILCDVEAPLVLLENAPALLAKHRSVVDACLIGAGYGVTWVRLAASHVGAPHIRHRVFVVGRRGGWTSKVIDLGVVPRTGRHWPTPTAGDARRSGKRHGQGACNAGRSLTDAVARGRGLSQHRLNPDWVELLLGLPPGWTRDKGPRLEIPNRPMWATAKGELRDHFEPPRTIIPLWGQHRTRRLRMTGNAVVWAQAERALQLAGF